MQLLIPSERNGSIKNLEANGGELTANIPGIIEASVLSVNSSEEFSGVTLSNPSELNNYLNSTYSNLNDQNIAINWVNGFSNEKISQMTSGREQNLIIEIKSVFENKNTVSEIVQELQAIKERNGQIEWGLNEGELYKGLIEIAINSASYWNTENNYPSPSSNSKNKNIVLRPVMSNEPGPVSTPDLSDQVPLSEKCPIQLDALGYLSGWVSAAWSDYNSPKGLQASGQKHRIGQGLIWAVSASTGGFLSSATQPTSPSSPEEINSPTNSPTTNP